MNRMYWIRKSILLFILGWGVLSLGGCNVQERRKLVGAWQSVQNPERTLTLSWFGNFIITEGGQTTTHDYELSILKQLRVPQGAQIITYHYTLEEDQLTLEALGESEIFRKVE